MLQLFLDVATGFHPDLKICLLVSFPKWSISRVKGSCHTHPKSSKIKEIFRLLSWFFAFQNRKSEVTDNSYIVFFKINLWLQNNQILFCLGKGCHTSWSSSSITENISGSRFRMIWMPWVNPVVCSKRYCLFLKLCLSEYSHETEALSESRLLIALDFPSAESAMDSRCHKT